MDLLSLESNEPAVKTRTERRWGQPLEAHISARIASTELALEFAGEARVLA